MGVPHRRTQPGPRIIVYEYQKTRHSSYPKENCKDFKEILMMDGLEQYHKMVRELEGVTGANRMSHARCHFANAVKVIGKGNEKVIQTSIAYKALIRIRVIYDMEGALKEYPMEECLREQQTFSQTTG